MLRRSPSFPVWCHQSTSTVLIRASTAPTRWPRPRDPRWPGLLVKLLGAPVAVLVDAASYLFAAVVVATLPVRERPVATTRMPNLRREIRDGMAWVYRESGLATLAIATHVWFAANAVLGAVVAPFALLTLGLSPLEFGITTAPGGLGALVGASTTGGGGRRLGTGGAVITAHLVTTVGVGLMVVAGLGTSGWVAAAVLGVGQAGHGFGMGFGNSHEMSYRQSRTPDELQARTNTTMRSFNRAVIVVVAPLGGLLADSAGVRPALVVAAAVFGASALMLAVSSFRRA
ncbi:MFS transporter [Actinomycetes bacterium KLBMP 9759]